MPYLLYNGYIEDTALGLYLRLDIRPLELPYYFYSKLWTSYLLIVAYSKLN